MGVPLEHCFPLCPFCIVLSSWILPDASLIILGLFESEGWCEIPVGRRMIL